MSNNSFEGDLLERKELAKRLLRRLHELSSGYVITIDAPWGDGKTFFAKNFKAMLDEKEVSSVLIDAFEHDYYEDPFVLLTSAILSEFDNSPIMAPCKADFIQKAIFTAKKIIPTIVKISTSMVTAGILSSKIQDNITSAISEAVGNVASGIIEEQLTNFENTKKGITAFKASLNKIATECVEQSKSEEYPDGFPLIIIIDELDRCKPWFAVQLLERIKHFFDTDNVVFIMMVNKVQLTEYIKGVYGVGVDAEGYLEKFIDLSINLSSLTPGQQRHNSYEYANRCPSYRPKQTDITRDLLNKNFRSFLLNFCTFNNIPLRCIDKYYSYIEFVSDRLKPDFAWYVGILILIKIMRPTLYDKFLLRDKNATDSVLEFLTAGITDVSTEAQKMKTTIHAAVQCFYNKDENPAHYCHNAPIYANDILRACEGSYQPQDAFIIASQFIDFKIY
jgi:hypothetical protein